MAIRPGKKVEPYTDLIPAVETFEQSKDKDVVHLMPSGENQFG